MPPHCYKDSALILNLFFNKLDNVTNTEQDGTTKSKDQRIKTPARSQEIKKGDTLEYNYLKLIYDVSDQRLKIIVRTSLTVCFCSIVRTSLTVCFCSVVQYIVLLHEYRPTTKCYHGSG